MQKFDTFHGHKFGRNMLILMNLCFDNILILEIKSLSNSTSPFRVAAAQNKKNMPRKAESAWQ